MIIVVVPIKNSKELLVECLKNYIEFYIITCVMKLSASSLLIALTRDTLFEKVTP